MGRTKHLLDQIEGDAIAAGAVALCPICGGYPISLGDDVARAKAIKSAQASGASDEMERYIDAAASVCPNCRVPAGDE